MSVNAHHQNGKAKVRIRHLQEMARTSMIHANKICPDAITPNLWPYATRVANKSINSTPWIYNPNKDSLSRVLDTHDSFIFKMCNVSIKPNLDLHMTSHIRKLLASEIVCWGFIWQSQVQLKLSLDCT